MDFFLSFPRRFFAEFLRLLTFPAQIDEIFVDHLSLRLGQAISRITFRRIRTAPSPIRRDSSEFIRGVFSAAQFRRRFHPRSRQQRRNVEDVTPQFRLQFRSVSGAVSPQHHFRLQFRPLRFPEDAGKGRSFREAHLPPSMDGPSFALGDGELQLRLEMRQVRPSLLLSVQQRLLRMRSEVLTTKEGTGRSVVPMRRRGSQRGRRSKDPTRQHGR